MDGTMSQEEINALLNNPSGTDENPENTLMIKNIKNAFSGSVNFLFSLFQILFFTI